MFLIPLADARPQVDTMPVFKTTNYPWETGSFKPLMYARVAAIVGAGVFFDFMAFERDPYISEHKTPRDILNDSCAALSFNFFPTLSDVALSIVINAAGQALAYTSTGGEPGAETIELELPVETYGGEDEQGWYWGGRFTLGPEPLNRVYGCQNLGPGHIMKGNLFKFLRAGSASHLGAVAPVFKGFIFESVNFGDFKIVAY